MNDAAASRRHAIVVPISPDDDRFVAVARPDDAWRPLGGVAALLLAGLTDATERDRTRASAWAAE